MKRLTTPTAEELRSHLLAQLEGRFWFLPIEDIETAFANALEDVRSFRKEVDEAEGTGGPALPPRRPGSLRFRLHVWISDPDTPPKSIPSELVEVPRERLQDVRNRISTALEADRALPPLSALVASLLHESEPA